MTDFTSEIKEAFGQHSFNALAATPRIAGCCNAEEAPIKLLSYILTAAIESRLLSWSAGLGVPSTSHHGTVPPCLICSTVSSSRHSMPMHIKLHMSSREIESRRCVFSITITLPSCSATGVMGSSKQGTVVVASTAQASLLTCA